MTSQLANNDGPTLTSVATIRTWLALLMLITGCWLLAAVIAMAFARGDDPIPVAQKSEQQQAACRRTA